ncbi:MAG: hypothetical protein QOF09_2024 [Alphaproteobacteria bacterium]|nr:hypothetical protein [Alphaproteobacteria bacterium]
MQHLMDRRRNGFTHRSMDEYPPCAQFENSDGGHAGEADGRGAFGRADDELGI